MTSFIRYLAIALLFSALSEAGAAQRSPSVTTLRDPYVPASAMPSTPPPAPTEGEALRQQVLAKLKRQFAAADLTQRGALTRDEARRGGFGLVSNHFDEIDRARHGEITFDDLVRYLRSTGANL